MTVATTIVPLSLGMVHAFLLRGERPILVDAGLPGSEERLEEALRRHGVSLDELSLIVLTHAHSDHAGAAAALRERSGAPLAAGAGDAADLAAGANAPLTPTGAMGRLMGRAAGEQLRFPPAVPDILAEDGFSLEPYGVDGRLLALPGHTPGSLAAHLADGRLLAGDLITGSFLLANRPSYPYFAADLAALRRSLRRVLTLAPTTLYPAHGRPCNGASLARRFGREVSPAREGGA
jgi:glyoxylase-like metal-dependent hydrolase (beta-lactamase superfamily II)